MKEKNRAIITLVIILIILLLVPMAAIAKSVKGNKILKELDELYTSKEMVLLYVGSKNCSFCEKYNPVIEKVSSDNKFNYYYIDITNLTNGQYRKLLAKLGKESEKFGTPYTALIQDNKIVGDLPGFVEANDLVEFLVKNKFIDENDAVKEEVNLNMIGYSEYSTLIKSENKSIIVLASSTCSACLAAKPVLDEIAKEKDLEINYLNVDKLSTEDYQSFTKSFEMFSGEWSTPTIIITENNKILKNYVGYNTKDVYIQFFKDNGFLN